MRRSHVAAFGTLAAAAVLIAVSACGAVRVSATTPAATASASASDPAAAQAPPATACSPGAPVPGCTEVGDPFGVPAACHVTVGVLLDAHSNQDKLPSYGFGAGPVYLSGQNSWFAGGEEALFLIDATYTGAVHITGQPVGSGGDAPVFTGSNANGSLIDVPSGNDQPYWRFWDGQMSFTQPGCYTLSLQTAEANETVTIYVHAGSAPPG